MNTSSSVQAAVESLAQGGIVVVVDDANREDEGDLIMGAQFATQDTVAFFLQHTSGFLCTALSSRRARALQLNLMVEDNTESHHTAFLVSVAAREQTTTGISAADRARTVRALADPATQPQSLARPGHIMPLLAKDGGVLERPGHTEASIDLCRLAGIEPAALLCEIVTEDRTDMMRGTELRAFARTHGLAMLAIEDLIDFRYRHQQLARSPDAVLPTKFGGMRALAYTATRQQPTEHLVLVTGDLGDGHDVPVRIHSECLTGDVLGSLRCDCGAQLEESMRRIAANERGVLVYLRGHEGRGIGLAHKLHAYNLQDTLGLDTVDANLALGLPIDDRQYVDAARILINLGVQSVAILSNNPDKATALRKAGIEVRSQEPLQVPLNRHNQRYIHTKQSRMGHSMEQPSST
jgi:GTP cyclohydrolase II/3,4-dihydroxy 2-butanone 4-phosphate synthase/GTP cyclohydrolase II